MKLNILNRVFKLNHKILLDNLVIYFDLFGFFLDFLDFLDFYLKKLKNKLNNYYDNKDPFALTSKT